MSTRFPYYGKLYQIEGDTPNKHIVLPDGRVLVVCRWDGNVPNHISDVRHSTIMSQQDAVTVLKGLAAQEIQPRPNETLDAMAILDFEDNRYAVSYEYFWRSKAIELPDGRLLKSKSSYPGEPMRIAEVRTLDPENEETIYLLENWGKVQARLETSNYPGMPSEPRDLRIRFSHKGEQYILSGEAYEQGISKIYIPDHGFFEVTGWLESMPVQIGGLKPIGSTNKALVALPIADAVDIE